MSQIEKQPRINYINFLVNLLLFLLPFEVIISNYSLILNRGVKLDLIFGLIANAMVIILLTKINWSIAYKINKYVIIATLIVIIIALVSSLVINTGTSYLFLEGLNSELIPLIFLILIYIYSQQNQFQFNRLTKAFLVFNIIMTNLLFVLSSLKNLPSKYAELLLVNPNYYGILNILLLAILTSIYSTSSAQNQSLIKVGSCFIIFLQLIFAPLTALFSVAGLIMLLVKNKYLNLILTRYIVLAVFTLTLGVSFLANLSGLNNNDYIATVRRDLMLIDNGKNYNYYGYGLGNAGPVGQFKYGNNYSQYTLRPLIKSLNENKELIPKVEIGIMELIINGGFVYALLYSFILFNIAYRQSRNSYYFYPVLILILTSLYFNPLSFLPIFLTFGLMSLLVL